MTLPYDEARCEGLKVGPGFAAKCLSCERKLTWDEERTKGVTRWRIEATQETPCPNYLPARELRE